MSNYTIRKTNQCGIDFYIYEAVSVLEAKEVYSRFVVAYDARAYGSYGFTYYL